MQYGFCKFPDFTTKFVKILDSDDTHIKVQYPWSEKIPTLIVSVWVHSSWVTLIGNECSLLSSTADFK